MNRANNQMIKNLKRKLKSKLNLFLIIGFLGCSLVSYANDSLQVLSLSEYSSWVLKNHPVAKQADLLLKTARASLITARGGFDAKLNASYEDKTFDAKNYYRYVETELKIPTWMGIEFKAGWDWVQGSAVNEENKTGQEGLSYAGISVSVLKNLFFDKRRAALRQAQVMEDMNDAQRKAELLDLMKESSESYLQWQLQQAIYDLAYSAYVNAEQRFQFVKSSYSFGDRPAIDTIEAYAQVRLRDYEWKQTTIELFNARLKASTFLWSDEGDPQWLKDIARADSLGPESIQFTISKKALLEWEVDAQLNQPAIQQYAFKLRSLDLERRLKLESFKPELNVQYNLLGKGYQLTPGTDGRNFLERYKAGIQFSMPLSFTQARGEYQQTKIKIQDTRFAQELKQNEVKMKVNQYFNEYTLYSSMETDLKMYSTGMNELVKGEQMRLEVGESSLFLVNTRESKYLEAMTKWYEICMKKQKSALYLMWVSGALLN